MSDPAPKFVSLEMLANWCRADADDPAILPSAMGAEQACLDFLDRAIFATAEDMLAAKQGAPADVAAAATARDAAIAAADGLAGDARCLALEMASSDYEDALEVARKVRQGMVVNDAVVAAILLTAASSYRNRENDLTGNSAAAVRIPQDAISYLRPHRRGLGL